MNPDDVKAAREAKKAARVARKAAPQTYGATGRPTAPPPSASQPLTLSRVL